MLEILPVSDAHRCEALAARFSLPFYKGAIGYTAERDGHTVAFCQFECTDTGAILRSASQTPNAPPDLLRILLIGVFAFCAAKNHLPIRAGDALPKETRALLGALSENWQFLP